MDYLPVSEYDTSVLREYPNEPIIEEKEEEVEQVLEKQDSFNFEKYEELAKEEKMKPIENFPLETNPNDPQREIPVSKDYINQHSLKNKGTGDFDFNSNVGGSIPQSSPTFQNNNMEINRQSSGMGGMQDLNNNLPGIEVTPAEDPFQEPLNEDSERPSLGGFGAQERFSNGKPSGNTGELTDDLNLAPQNEPDDAWGVAARQEMVSPAQPSIQLQEIQTEGDMESSFQDESFVEQNEIGNLSGFGDGSLAALELY